MKILHYTTSSNNYSYVTNMSVKSFLKNCSGEFTIFSPHEIEDKIVDSRVTYINSEKYFEKNYIDLSPMKKCCFLKSKIHKIIDISYYQLVIYADSDILYFKDIHQPISIMDDNFIHISSDHRKNICSGFLFFSPRKYPLFLSEWESLVPPLITKKYIDQLALQKLLIEKYINNFRLISSEVMSFKKKTQDCYANHYVNLKRRLVYMIDHYNKEIIFMNNNKENIFMNKRKEIIFMSKKEE